MPRSSGAPVFLSFTIAPSVPTKGCPSISRRGNRQVEPDALKEAVGEGPRRREALERYIAEIKVDSRSKPIDLTVNGSRAYSGRLQFAPEVPIDDATKAKLSGSRSGGLGRQFDCEASLPLDDPENARLAEDFLRAYTLDPDLVLPQVDALRDRIDERATVTLSTRGTYESGKEYGASASFGAKLGGKLVRAESGSRLIEAHTRQPGASFVQRADCVPP